MEYIMANNQWAVGDKVVFDPSAETPVTGQVNDVMPDGRLLILLDKSGKRIIRQPDEVQPASTSDT
jgi:hypothetical protein